MFNFQKYVGIACSPEETENEEEKDLISHPQKLSNYGQFFNKYH